MSAPGELRGATAAAVAAYADRTFLVEPRTGETATYADFGERLRRFAALLAGHGVGPGDAVALVSENSIDLAVALYGTMVHGAVAMPLNPRLTAAEAGTLLRHSGAALALADRPLDLGGAEARVLDVAAYRHREPAAALSTFAPAPDTGALLIYTSGTTGSPKGVLLRHGNLASNVRTALARLPFAERHTTLCLLPLFHTFGLVSDLSTMLFSGGTVVVMPTFDVAAVRDVERAIAAHAVQSFSAVPLIFDVLTRLGCRLGGGAMRFCVSGAAPLPEPVRLRFAETHGFPILPAYGLTETTCFCTISPHGAVVPGSAGRPAGIEVRVVSESGEDLPPGEIGELAVRGPSVMAGGYYKGPRDGYLDAEDTWFRTGDLGRLDEAGYVFLTGRKKNMVIRGGEKIYLEDIDRCLADCPGVADSATVRVDGDVERIVCFVVPAAASPAAPQQVLDFIAGRMGRSRQPDRVELRGSIPRTATNKVRVGELQRLAAGAAP